MGSGLPTKWDRLEPLLKPAKMVSVHSTFLAGSYIPWSSLFTFTISTSLPSIFNVVHLNAFANGYIGVYCAVEGRRGGDDLIRH